MLTDRLYFGLCHMLGWLLRSARYSKARIVGAHVWKRRSFYAPFLIWLGGPLVRILDPGVRVLPQRSWEERERSVYHRLYGIDIGIEGDGTLVLPRLPGRTLADLLEDEKLEESDRKRSIEWAVASLALFHRSGLTHGDAMAGNVLVDLEAAAGVEAGIARWFDFETVHDATRPMAWRRADDVRALLATCLVRTAPAKRTETLRLILDVYADEDVTRLLATSFAAPRRRALPFHLGQAALSRRCYREIAALLACGAAR